MSLFAELRNRNVLRVGAAYLVSSWLLIQVVETLAPLFGFGPGPARMTVILLAIGLVPTLVATWAFRWTPEGLRRESTLPALGEASGASGKTLDRWVMVALALAVGLFAFDRFVLDPGREAERTAQAERALQEARESGRSEALVGSFGDRSIAVLPFVNMSDDPGNEYFSDGISEELLNLLANMPGLRVISRSSAFSYKGQDIRVDQIARDLNVAHVLEGSVRKSGQQVRITAQLIAARTDTHLWSQTWDRTLGDVFAIQDEIAAQVLERLQVTLLDSDGPRVRQVEPEAYALYLQATALARQGSEEGYRQAIGLLQRALALDQDYPQAWTALAGIDVNLAGKGILPWEEGFAQARAATEKALAIDPDFAPAHDRLGWIAMIQDDDLAVAARHYRRALQLAPGHPGVIGNSAQLLRSLGRIEASVRLDEYLVARDPVNALLHFNLGAGYISAGRYDEAVASIEKSLLLNPSRVAAHYRLGVALLLGGDAAAALEAFRAEPLEVLKVIGEALALHALGDREVADATLLRLETEFERDAAYNIAYVHAFRGEHDAAFAWLERAVAYADPGVADVVAEPLFAGLRDDHRWLPFMASIDRDPAVLDAIEFEVRLPGP